MLPNGNRSSNGVRYEIDMGRFWEWHLARSWGISIEEYRAIELEQAIKARQEDNRRWALIENQRLAAMVRNLSAEVAALQKQVESGKNLEPQRFGKRKQIRADQNWTDRRTALTLRRTGAVTEIVDTLYPDPNEGAWSSRYVAATDADRAPNPFRRRRHLDVFDTKLAKCIDDCVDHHGERRCRAALAPRANAEPVSRRRHLA